MEERAEESYHLPAKSSMPHAYVTERRSFRTSGEKQALSFINGFTPPLANVAAIVWVRDQRRPILSTIHSPFAGTIYR
jgi:hypothetical protein